MIEYGERVMPGISTPFTKRDVPQKKESGKHPIEKRVGEGRSYSTIGRGVGGLETKKERGDSISGKKSLEDAFPSYLVQMHSYPCMGAGFLNFILFFLSWNEIARAISSSRFSLWSKI